MFSQAALCHRASVSRHEDGDGLLAQSPSSKGVFSIAFLYVFVQQGGVSTFPLSVAIPCAFRFSSLDCVSLRC